MADINIKADLLPTITEGEKVLANALKLVETFTDGDQQQKRQIVRELKKATKAIKYANKAFLIADKIVTDKKYLKYRGKFELYD